MEDKHEEEKHVENGIALSKNEEEQVESVDSDSSTIKEFEHNTPSPAQVRVRKEPPRMEDFMLAVTGEGQ